MFNCFQTFRQKVWKGFCQSILFLTGWELKIHPDYTETSKQIVVFPHTSGWELVLALLVQYAHDIKNVKIIVWNGQFKGLMSPILKWLGCTPIENRKSTGATQTISNYLNTQKQFKFCISPEGSREYRDKFRSGFFYITQNTKAIYNIVTFNYETHTMNFGKLIHSTKNFQQDCEIIQKEFAKGVPLYPECTMYGCAPHKQTSMVNWKKLSIFTSIPIIYFTKYYANPLAILFTWITFLSFL